MARVSEIAKFIRSRHRYLLAPDPWDDPEVRDEIYQRWPGATDSEIDIARQTARELFEADCAYKLETGLNSDT
jgi:hypothetical protein